MITFNNYVFATALLLVTCLSVSARVAMEKMFPLTTPENMELIDYQAQLKCRDKLRPSAFISLEELDEKDELGLNFDLFACYTNGTNKDVMIRLQRAKFNEKELQFADLLEFENIFSEERCAMEVVFSKHPEVAYQNYNTQERFIVAWVINGDIQFQSFGCTTFPEAEYKEKVTEIINDMLNTEEGFKMQYTILD